MADAQHSHVARPSASHKRYLHQVDSKRYVGWHYDAVEEECEVFEACEASDPQVQID